MPMACRTSALRRLASARSLRRAASVIAALAGVRVRNSVISVSATRMRRRPGGDAEQPMKGEADREIERDPGQIEQGDGPPAGEKCRIWSRSRSGCWPSFRLPPAAAADHGLEDAPAQNFIDRGPMRPSTRPRIMSRPPWEKKRTRRESQPDQRRHAAARQDAVIDLQHEK